MQSVCEPREVVEARVRVGNVKSQCVTLWLSDFPGFEFCQLIGMRIGSCGGNLFAGIAPPRAESDAAMVRIECPAEVLNSAIDDRLTCGVNQGPARRFTCSGLLDRKVVVASRRCTTLCRQSWLTSTAGQENSMMMSSCQPSQKIASLENAESHRRPSADLLRSVLCIITIDVKGKPLFSLRNPDEKRQFSSCLTMSLANHRNRLPGRLDAVSASRFGFPLDRRS